MIINSLSTTRITKYSLFVSIIAISVFFGLAASAATVTVDSLVGEANAIDGECNVGEAINSINTGADSGDCVADVTDPYGTNDTIAFNIGGGGAQEIVFGASIGSLIQPVLIDGTTQPDGVGGFASCGSLADLSDRNLLIAFNLNDQAAVSFSTGSDGGVLQGVAIFGSSNAAINIDTDNITIRCNHIGTNLDASGPALNDNEQQGISFHSVASTSGLIVGGGECF